VEGNVESIIPKNLKTNSRGVLSGILTNSIEERLQLLMYQGL
jgi:hypothetical protein